MILNIIRSANYYLVISLMATMMTIVIFQTLSRYLFKIPLFWAEELARYLMIWLTFSAAAIVMREGGHVSVVFLTSYLSLGFQKGIKILVKIFLGIFLAFLIVKGIVLCTVVYKQMSPTMRISMFWPYLAIPFGSFLMMVELCASFFEKEYEK